MSSSAEKAAVTSYAASHATATSRTTVAEPLWMAVEAHNLSHLFPPTTTASETQHAGTPAAMDRIRAASEAAGLPDIAVSPAQGRFMALLCKLMGAQRILEVGTLGGYSSAWFTSSGPQVRVTTLEVNAEYVEVARGNLETVGVADRVEIVVGLATESLERIVAEVEASSREVYDLAFIDANKEDNWKYFSAALKVVRKGGCIIVDNVVRAGRVVDEAWAENSAIIGTKELIEKVGKEERVEATILQTVDSKAYDGFLLAWVRK